MCFYQGDSGGPLVQKGGKWKAVGDKWIQVGIGDHDLSFLSSDWNRLFWVIFWVRDGVACRIHQVILDH